MGETKYIGKVSDEELAGLKEKHGKVKVMEVPVNDAGTEVAVGYFKPIDRQTMGASLSISDPVASKELVLNTCFIGGDKRILEDDELFFSACLLVDQMMAFRRGELKKA